MTKGVLTKYYVNGNPYVSYIIGHKLSEINKLANQRGLGETIESRIMKIDTMPRFSTFPDVLFKHKLPHILHSSIFLAYMAVKANIIDTEELLSDEGVLHELAHLLLNLDGCHENSLTCVRELVLLLEEKTIGLY
jgi:hypothetical protein